MEHDVGKLIRNQSDSNTLTELVGHGDQISGSRFSDNGALLVTYSQDNTARLWDGKTGASLGTLIGHTNNVRSADFNPAGIALATVGDTTVRLWMFSAKLTDNIKNTTTRVHSVEFARTGDHFVTGGIVFGCGTTQTLHVAHRSISIKTACQKPIAVRPQQL